MTWLYNNQEVSEIPEGVEAFVYLIRRKDTGRMYIGKKKAQFTKTKQVKGKKKRYKVESDWRTYYGSNKELCAEVEELGADLFEREILHWCKTLGTSNYLEAREQMDRRVLESSAYYNGQIMCRVNQSQVKL